MNDPISEMKTDGIRWECAVLLGHAVGDYLPDEKLIGEIILKLQEWDHVFRWNRDGWVVGGSCYHETSLPRAFLKAAVILGKWSPPKKVEELEYLRRKSDGAVRHLKEFDPAFREDWERVTVTPYKETTL